MTDKPDRASSRSKLSGRFRLITALTVVVVLGVAGWFVFGTGEEKPPTKCGTAPNTGVTEASAEPGDGKKISAETGWLRGADHGHTEGITFGVELTNPSEDVARNVVVEYRFIDGDGKEVDEEALDGANVDPIVEIPVIMPGEKVGFGGLLFTYALPNPQQPPDEIVYEGGRIEAEVHEVEWWPMKNDVYGFASVSTEIIKTEFKVRVGALPDVYDLRYRFMTDSKYCAQTKGQAPSGLVRDANGEIIGGWPTRPNPKSTIYPARGDTGSNGIPQETGNIPAAAEAENLTAYAMSLPLELK